MKIYGQRSDGSLLISLGGGVGVIMRGTNASKATDLDTLYRRMGPWTAPDAKADVRQVAKQLDRCRTVALSNFNLGIAESMSFDERRDRVYQALCSRLGIPTNSAYGPMSMNCYIPQNGLGEDWVVYCMNGKHYGLGYSIDEASGAVTFDGTAQEVTPSWEELGERAEEEAGMEVELKNSSFFKNYSKFKMSKKKALMEELPGSLPNVNKPV